MAVIVFLATAAPAAAEGIEDRGPHSRALVAQASTDDFDEGISDPIEPVNRFIFQVNEVLEAMLIRPIADMYEIFIPPPVRNAITNVLDNIRGPVIFFNDVMQGEGERATVTLQRFVLNTTFGVGGIWDPAAGQGLEKHDEDFGQTLAVWGVGDGFYMVLPIFGPTNPRDAVGRLIVDPHLNPFEWWVVNTDRDTLRYTRWGMTFLDRYVGVKDELDRVKELSIDYYAAVRSMYYQRRAAEIRNGDPGEIPEIPELSFDFEEQDLPREPDVQLSADPQG